MRASQNASKTHAMLLNMTNARDLSNRLAELLRHERGAMADFLLALSAFDREERWRELGYTSLFYYLHRELGLSLGAAQHRKTAVELLHALPEIVEPLRDGRLCLSVVCEVQKVLTAENRHDVLPRFFGLSRRDAEALVAELRPAQVVPMRTVVTSLRTTPSAGTSAPLDLVARAPAFHPGETVLAPVKPDPVPAPPPRRDEVVPLTAELRRLAITVSKRFTEKLAAARDALSHSHPGATEAEVLETALDLLLARDAKRKGLVEKPCERKPALPSNPRYVPAEVRRAVWKRDGGRCQWPMPGGGICGSTHRCEIDHIQPVALGGESTIENTRVVCRDHNDEAARRAFGDPWMDKFTRRKRRRAGGPAAQRRLTGEALPRATSPARTST